MVRDPSIVSPSLTGVFIGGVTSLLQKNSAMHVKTTGPEIRTVMTVTEEFT